MENETGSAPGPCQRAPPKEEGGWTVATMVADNNLIVNDLRVEGDLVVEVANMLTLSGVSCRNLIVFGEARLIFVSASTDIAGTIDYRGNGRCVLKLGGGRRLESRNVIVDGEIDPDLLEGLPIRAFATLLIGLEREVSRLEQKASHLQDLSDARPLDKERSPQGHQ